MFLNSNIINKYEQLKNRLINVIDQINSGLTEMASKSLVSIIDELKVLTSNINITNEELDELFVFKSYISFLLEYNLTWKMIRENRFSKSWNHLQNSMDYLRAVKKFSKTTDNSKFIPFFEDQLINLESLYPYKVFFSIGCITEKCTCSICGENIDSLECPHIKGELYGGVMACAIIEKSEINHVAMVKNPKDKRCVVQYDDQSEQFKLIRYLSNLLDSKKITPLGFGKLKYSSKILPNPDYKKIGRNQKCFCGSNKKFKNCCIESLTIECKHVDIVSDPKTAESIMT
ncbi:MAG: hypothetical protein GY714_12265 [Desulfobacterales bacterium]|nr:hypothetical protein [Desulfobacterales bacterium]